MKIINTSKKPVKIKRINTGTYVVIHPGKIAEYPEATAKILLSQHVELKEYEKPIDSGKAKKEK